MNPALLEQDRPVRADLLGADWDGISRAEAVRRLLARTESERVHAPSLHRPRWVAAMWAWLGRRWPRRR